LWRRNRLGKGLALRRFRAPSHAHVPHAPGQLVERALLLLEQFLDLA
jgi:hypothetical protein